MLAYRCMGGVPSIAWNYLRDVGTVSAGIKSWLNDLWLLIWISDCHWPCRLSSVWNWNLSYLYHIGSLQKTMQWKLSIFLHWFHMECRHCVLFKRHSLHSVRYYGPWSGCDGVQCVFWFFELSIRHLPTHGKRKIIGYETLYRILVKILVSI